MTTQLQSHSLKTLYDTDFHLWLESHINLLKNGKLHQLDLENLIEELESMGKNNKNSLKSNLVILLMHLLKYKYQKDKRSNSWKFTIREHRHRLQDSFTDSPSLRRYFNEVFNQSYQRSRQYASDETELPLITFPLECPFTQSQVLDEDFLPE
ncbi:MAG TPA: DUF29 domain-containing protein [Allocoleopsis sp.]